MAITKYPLIDAFETTLSQEWDGNTGTIYVNSVPEFTFPSGVTTYIVVDADNSKIQVAEINAISTGAKTITVNSVSVEKGNSVAYTPQVHSIGAKVRISDNYIFWKTIVDAVNSLETSFTNTGVITNVGGTFIGTYADATARDAAITSPLNGKYQIYLTSEGYWTDYVGGSWQQRATGVTPNAGTTVAGKVELSTDAQITAGTATGETGAPLVATPDQLKKSISLRNSTSSFNDADEFSINQGGEDKRITKTAMRDQLAASTTAKGTVEMAEDSEVKARTDETRAINSKQRALDVNLLTGTLTTTSSVTIAHGLGTPPRIVMMQVQNTNTTASGKTSTGNATYDGSTIKQKVRDSDQRTIYYDGIARIGDTDGSLSSPIEYSMRAISAIDQTNITLSYTFEGNNSIGTPLYVITVIA